MLTPYMRFPLHAQFSFCYIERFQGLSLCRKTLCWTLFHTFCSHQHHEWRRFTLPATVPATGPEKVCSTGSKRSHQTASKRASHQQYGQRKHHISFLVTRWPEKLPTKELEKLELPLDCRMDQTTNHTFAKKSSKSLSRKTLKPIFRKEQTRHKILAAVPLGELCKCM
jgi:hypothetical protein